MLFQSTYLLLGPSVDRYALDLAQADAVPEARVRQDFAEADTCIVIGVHQATADWVVAQQLLPPDMLLVRSVLLIYLRLAHGKCQACLDALAVLGEHAAVDEDTGPGAEMFLEPRATPMTVQMMAAQRRSPIDESDHLPVLKDLAATLAVSLEVLGRELLDPHDHGWCEQSTAHSAHLSRQCMWSVDGHARTGQSAWYEPFSGGHAARCLLPRSPLRDFSIFSESFTNDVVGS